jgi:uncharacterized protein (TIGR02996 family)/excisionase family DNA binding protein
MIRDRDAIYAAILQNPADDLPRMAYADLLEEHNELARAEFIRVQLRLAQSESAEDRQREQELLNEHVQEWLTELPVEQMFLEMPKHRWRWRREPLWDASVQHKTACFLRGFVGMLWLPTQEYEEWAHVLCNRFPVERLQLAGLRPTNEAGGWLWDVDGVQPWTVRGVLEHSLQSSCELGRQLPSEDEAFEQFSQALIQHGKEYGNKIGFAAVYTTGRIAQILGVAPGTVVRWFDSGKLPGYRIPGTGDRRITRADLVKLIRQEKYFPPPMRERLPVETQGFDAERQAREMSEFRRKVRSKDPLTTGDIARICEVRPDTVRRWVDRGILGSGLRGNVRLVPRGELLRFLKEHELPEPKEWEEGQ